MATLFTIITTIQQALFPALEKELAAPLGEKGELFVTVVELARPQAFSERFEWQGRGCPRKWRLPILLSFIAKAVWNFPTTRALLDRLAHDPHLRRLCGWGRAGEIPSEATFSRAFAEFAASELPQQIHAALLGEQLGAKLVGHVSRDATAIVGREKPAAPAEPPAAPPQPAKPRRKMGRPPKGVAPAPAEPTRLERQGGRTLAENLAELPRVCDRGVKRDSKGRQSCWVGYKLHLDVADGDIPLAAVLSSASLHDSQVAIALAQMTAGRVSSLYDVMDAAYDAAPIHGFSRRLGHVPVIAPQARGGKQPVPLDPAKRARFGERTAAERVNSDLKENHGGNSVRVRGAVKVMGHLMLGVLVVAVKGLVRLLE
jgi:hypothetical protein